MRRMFSEKQIKEMALGVSEEAIEEALEGDISITGDLSVSGAINGEENPSLKPVYLHPIEIRANNDRYNIVMTCLVFNNSSTAFNMTSFKTWLDTLNIEGSVTRVMISGGIYSKSNSRAVINSYMYKYYSYYGLTGMRISDGGTEDIQDSWDNLFENATLNDGVNKIN